MVSHFQFWLILIVQLVRLGQKKKYLKEVIDLERIGREFFAELVE